MSRELSSFHCQSLTRSLFVCSTSIETARSATGGEEFVIVFIGGREPFGGTVRKYFLKEGSAAPRIEIGVFAEIGLEDYIQCGATGHDNERYKRRIGVGDAVPVAQSDDEFLGARIFGLDFFCGGGHQVGEESVRVTVGVGLDF